MKKDRREFIKSGLRWCAFGALAGLTTVLVKRDQKCTNKSVCCQCAQADDCELPPAVMSRKTRVQK